MPTEFQKAMDCTLQGLEGVICYLDDILVVTKVRDDDHNILVDNDMQRLNEEDWTLKLSKCEFSVNKLIWLGYEIDETLQNSPKLRLSNHLFHRKLLGNQDHLWELSIISNVSFQTCIGIRSHAEPR